MGLNIEYIAILAIVISNFVAIFLAKKDSSRFYLISMSVILLILLLSLISGDEYVFFRNSVILIIFAILINYLFYNCQKDNLLQRLSKNDIIILAVFLSIILVMSIYLGKSDFKELYFLKPNIGQNIEFANKLNIFDKNLTQISKIEAIFDKNIVLREFGLLILVILSVPLCFSLKKNKF